LIDEYKQRSLNWALEKHDVQAVGQKLYGYYRQLL